MAQVASKKVRPDPAGGAIFAEVTLDDGRTGFGKDGGFRRGDDHIALTRAIQNANSTKIPSYEYRGCFPGDANILTPSGQRRLDTIQKHDVVLSFDQKTMKMVTRRVIKVIGPKHCSISQISFSAERATIRATPTHKVLTKRGWIKVASLNPGDQLVAISKLQITSRIVTDVSTTSERLPVFNLITEGEHNFIVDGVIAHNFSLMRRLRTLVFDLAHISHTPISPSMAERPT